MKVLDKFNLKDKVSIVTGGAMGLGKEMSRALAQAGSNIVIADLNFEEAAKTANEFQKNEGIKAIPVRMDVTEEDQVNDMVNTVLNQFGKIDVLFNNAGITNLEKAENTSFEDWYKVININLNGVFLVSKAVGKVMIKQKKGSIINISSMSGIIANTPQCQASYNTSKAGVIMLSKSLALEWAQHNIRVNTIAPGYMKTELTKSYFEENSDMVKTWIDLTPMKRPGIPEELGGIALYLASEASSFVTGSVYTVDGGYTAV
ncbi:SDR family NAD(P)-dependent oxidoreductase [Priestia endophytica]|uniref:SDR family NAD(P)-dependent oxidoreductase n=1 Tax=Priestia endophytica TaxID=135735 RepID=UPI000F52C495|nr:glucose 1-dehydrogenase [Priestia endophytica]MED4073691.1 glucose 1-dehydrogenase [Priestia endophytica]RPK10706.1 3-oxoacyl-[acyl-carrier protein] reductase [Priestia endophytica]